MEVVMNDDILLAPRDAGRLLGITTAGVIRLAERGRLAELRDSANRRLFRREDVERLVQERRNGRRASK
jgi:predicted site-specific integrase-resolvase